MTTEIELRQIFQGLTASSQPLRLDNHQSKLLIGIASTRQRAIECQSYEIFEFCERLMERIEQLAEQTE